MASTKTLLEVEEQNPLVISEAEMDRSLILTLVRDFRRTVDIEFPSILNDHSYAIQSKGYIGSVPIDERHTLRISPKISIGNVFRLLEYAYNLKSFHLYEGDIELSSIEDFYDRLASILSKLVLDRNRKGLFRDYVGREEDLPMIRGRVRVEETAKRLIAGNTRVFCGFEEHTADLEDNQIIAWTLHRISRHDIGSHKTKVQVRRSYRELSSKVSLQSFEPKDCINRFYHRLNQDYQQIHALCRFFLEHAGPDLDHGAHGFIPFLVHMPNLFESFVAEWLNVHLPSEFHIAKQFKVRLDSELGLRYEIDLVLRETATKRVLAVLDTKYKRPPKPSMEDIEQIVAYAAGMGSSLAILIYPSAETSEMASMWGEDIHIRSLVLDIEGDPEVGGRRFLEKLFQSLEVANRGEVVR